MLRNAFYSNRLKMFFFIAALSTVIFLQFRFQILNYFTVLYGDRYDAVIVVTILEHWFNVLKGLSHWSEVNYFFPYTHTLGHTDGYFILGVIYSAFRYSGLDPFLSSELVNIAIRAIGFSAFFMTCRKLFGFSFWWSLLAASLFVLSNNSTAHGQRLQLATVAFAPVLTLLIGYACKALYTKNSRQFLIFGSAAGVFLGAWSITCFYMTWFFIFFTTIFFVIFILNAGSIRLNVLKENVRSQKLLILCVLVITVLSLLPLLSVYLTKSQESGMRPYASVMTVPIQGILQVGTENYLFGKLYNALLGFISPGYIKKNYNNDVAPMVMNWICTPEHARNEYYNTGIAPILFFLFLAGCFLVFKYKSLEDRQFFLRCLSIATIATWVLALKIGGHSAWYMVFHLFPGAKALRIIAAYQIFLTLPVIVIAISYLSSISHQMPAAILFMLVSLLCLEELNAEHGSLNRQVELKRVALQSPPPQQCSAFFVTGWPDQDTAAPMPGLTNNYYAHNVSAMLIAELIHLPTINGFASFNPPDWNFGYPNNADYIQRIRQYAAKHQIKDLCKLNLDTLTWATSW
ncbi:MAG: hypothetical protein PHG00_00255 [Methylococcales bacterium]|nr:hypothetical protein [Methylococcales bacterium]